MKTGSNQNGISEQGELKSLTEYSIKELDLNYIALNQFQNQNQMKKIIFFLATIILLINPNQSQAMPFFNKKLPPTPISTPIDFTKKGNKNEIDIRIETKKEKAEYEPESTAFEVRFLYDDPRRDPKSKYYISFTREFFNEIGALSKYLKPQYTKKEEDIIWKDHNRVINLLDHKKLIKSGFGQSYKSEWIEHKGVPIPNLKLTIIDLDDPDQKVVYDQVLEVRKHPWMAGYFDKWLDRIDLKPGNYKVITESMADAPEFVGTNVLLEIGSYRSKY